MKPILTFNWKIGSGSAAFMAIRVLLDHGVPESQIIFVTLLIARNGGIVALRQAFPGIRFISGAVDESLVETTVEDENGASHTVYVIEPGLGQIGDRYYL